MKISYFSFIGLICYLFILRSETINTGLINKSGYRLETRDTIPGRPIYVDINTGDSLDLWYDPVKFVTIIRKTNMPVDFYINTVTWDTVYGRGKFVVNNLIIKDEQGKYKLDESKVKIEGDELKIKDGLKSKSKGNKKDKTKDGKTKVKEE